MVTAILWVIALLAWLAGSMDGQVFWATTVVVAAIIEAAPD